jgi:hypothetical protein
VKNETEGMSFGKNFKNCNGKQDRKWKDLQNVLLLKKIIYSFNRLLRHSFLIPRNDDENSSQ